MSASHFTTLPAPAKAVRNRAATGVKRASDSPVKPEKPYPEYPLFPHATGRWAKKIRGKLVYFGAWDDPQAALDRYQAEKDDLHAGRKPRPDAEALTVKEIVNAFLNHKDALLRAGELSPRTRRDYQETCDLLVSHLGKLRLVADVRPDDFASLRNKMSQRWGLHRLAKTIQYTRSVFKHALDAGIIDKPVCYGPGFARPSKRTFRLERAKQGAKVFTREEIHKLLGGASVPMRAMLLLGINGGFGNADCAGLPIAAVDFDAGWIDFPRPKTGIKRRCPLWSETVEALRAVLAERPGAKDAAHNGLVFITKYGGTWGKDTSDNPIAKETAKLLKALCITGRKGLGFYTLRHVFRTVADETKDQIAVDFIMGHEVAGMSTVYRESVSDERLRAVTDYVRAWLFADHRKNSRS
jgi:integrase